jgi:hypothetical protein
MLPSVSIDTADIQNRITKSCSTKYMRTDAAIVSCVAILWLLQEVQWRFL